MKAVRWLAGWTLAGFLVGVPLLHIAGPNYHHPVPRHAVAVAHHAHYSTNPYLPLASAPSVATATPSAKSGAMRGIHPHARPYLLWRAMRGNRGTWRLWQRRNRNK